MRKLSSPLVPNDALREVTIAAVEAGRMTWADLAREVSPSGRGDGVRIKRMLGVAPSYSKGRKPVLQTQISDENAAKLCRALGVYPVDVGI